MKDYFEYWLEKASQDKATRDLVAFSILAIGSVPIWATFAFILPFVKAATGLNALDDSLYTIATGSRGVTVTLPIVDMLVFLVLVSLVLAASLKVVMPRFSYLAYLGGVCTFAITALVLGATLS